MSQIINSCSAKVIRTARFELLSRVSHVSGIIGCNLKRSLFQLILLIIVARMIIPNPPLVNPGRRRGLTAIMNADGVAFACFVHLDGILRFDSKIHASLVLRVCLYRRFLPLVEKFT